MEDLEDNLEKYFGQYVDTEGITSKKYFKAAVDVALREYDVPVSEIASAFQVADSTVLRWANGVAVPFPRLRQRILEWIVENIDDI